MGHTRNRQAKKAIDVGDVRMTASGTKSTGGFMAKYWWITLIRGIAALLLGMALLVAPVRGRPMMAQYMGMYWLASGVLSVVWGMRAARRPGVWLVAGVVGVLGGLAIVSRSLFSSLVAPASMVNLFAVVAISTGVLHLLGGYQIQRDHGHKWSWGSFFLGVVQIMLGVLILLSPEEVPREVLYVAMIWALVGGIGLLLDALRLRRVARSAGQEDTL